MRTKPVRVLSMVSIAAMCLFACAGTTAPHGWLAGGELAEHDPYGAWIEINYTSDGIDTQARGEFIGLRDHVVIVLIRDSISAIPESDIYSARLTAFDSQYGALVGWSVVGTLSTMSHGVGLLISAPAWIITGVAASSSQSHTPMRHYPDKTWRELSQYARFPQGVPIVIESGGLTGKHIVKPPPRRPPLGS